MKSISALVLAASLLIRYVHANSCSDGSGAEIILTPGDSVNASFPQLNFTPEYAFIYSIGGGRASRKFDLLNSSSCDPHERRAYTITIDADYPEGKSSIRLEGGNSTYCVTVFVGQAVSDSKQRAFEAYCLGNTSETSSSLPTPTTPGTASNSSTATNFSGTQSANNVPTTDLGGTTSPSTNLPGSTSHTTFETSASPYPSSTPSNPGISHPSETMTEDAPDIDSATPTGASSTGNPDDSTSSTAIESPSPNPTGNVDDEAQTSGPPANTSTTETASSGPTEETCPCRP
jgi:hypothetical protein